MSSGSVPYMQLLEYYPSSSRSSSIFIRILHHDRVIRAMCIFLWKSSLTFIYRSDMMAPHLYRHTPCDMSTKPRDMTSR